MSRESNRQQRIRDIFSQLDELQDIMGAVSAASSARDFQRFYALSEEMLALSQRMRELREQWGKLQPPV